MNRNMGVGRNGHSHGAPDGLGSGGGAGSGSPGGDTKTPVSFKEFTNRMLEDDVTAQEAQRRYEKYLQRFRKSDDVVFFEAHKDEEWFQERYDPIIIERSIEARRQNARDKYWAFYEQFLCDELPEVHDNVKDFRSVPDTLGHQARTRSMSASRSPGPPQGAGMEADGGSKEEGSASTSTEMEMEAERKRKTGNEGVDGDAVNGDGDGAPTTTSSAASESVVGDENGDIPTTALGAGSGGSEQVEGAVNGKSGGMDVEGDGDGNGDGDGKELASGGGVPRDGKVRLPKYADIMFADDYEPRTRSAWLPANNWKRDRAECYENSVFIQGIPLHIQREKIVSLFCRREGFEKLILSDPIRNARKVRYGWVTFRDQESCRKVLKPVDDGGLNGHQLTGQYQMNLLPKQRSKRKPKFSPPESLYPHRARKDLERALECARKFDAEAGILDNPLLNEAMLKELSEIRRLNLVLLYLRRIHFLCYYCGKHFLSEEHLFARCSAMHERKVPADISLAISGNIDIDDQTESGQIIKKERTNWEKELDQRIHDVVHYVMDHKHSWIERKQLKMLEKHTKRVSESKFRCTICSKLFKAEQYVTKHIGNKHQMDIAKYIADQRLRTMFENYRRDRDRLTLKSFEVADDGNGPRRGDRGGPHRAMNRGGGGHGGHGGHMGMHHGAGGRDREFRGKAYGPRGGGGGMMGHGNMHHGHPPHPHSMNRMGNTYGPQRGYGRGQGMQSVGAPGPQQMQFGGGPPGHGAGPKGGVGAGRGSGDHGVAMHPERESNLSAAAGPMNGARRGDGMENGGRGPRPEMGRGRGGMGRSPYQEPRGRKMLFHLDEPTRTRRSYREVDIEFPEQEADESGELDYGFGDFDHNPTKFNL